MKLNLKVTMQDATVYEVAAGVPDIVAWEMRFKGKYGDWANGIGMNELCFVAWNCLSRTKQTGMKYEQWLDLVEDIDYEVDDPKATDEEA